MVLSTQAELSFALRLGDLLSIWYFAPATLFLPPSLDILAARLLLVPKDFKFSSTCTALASIESRIYTASGSITSSSSAHQITLLLQISGLSIPKVSLVFASYNDNYATVDLT